VRVHIPLRVLGEGPKSEATFRYVLGPFSSREIPVSVESDRQIDLRFRLPKELFRSGEYLDMEVFSPRTSGVKNVLWSMRYQVSWHGEAPYLDAMTD
jgi:hypothetical protein